MSKTIERALDEVLKSQFKQKDDGTIEVLNAFIFWTNFEGKANKWGNTAKTFNLAIREEDAPIFTESGWRVRTAENPDGRILYFINVKVNMLSQYPPVVALYSEFRGKRSRRLLDNDSIAELDRISIESCDCIISAYKSKQYENKVTGYLRKLNVIQEADIEFGGKYDDWLDEDPLDFPEVIIDDSCLKDIE